MNKKVLSVITTICIILGNMFPAMSVTYEVGISPDSGQGTSTSAAVSSQAASAANGSGAGVTISSTPQISSSTLGPGADQASNALDASSVGSQYAGAPKVSIDLGFTLVSPAYDYNGIKVAEGSVQLLDGSWAYIGHDSYIDDGYYRLQREQTDSTGVQWYIVSLVGTQIGSYHTQDGSTFSEVWLKKDECTATSTISLNTSNTLRQNIVRTALSLLGRGYAYGSSGPDTFDCSGFVGYVMSQNGISVPRSSSEICVSAGTEISGGASGLRPGDIVGRSGHVGIYIGDGYFVHSSEADSGVKVDLVWQYNRSSPFTNYRNVVGD